MGKESEFVFQERKRTKFLGLPFCFTKYFINEEKIMIRSGFLSTTEDDAMMYKVQDTKLCRGLMERLFGLGTVVCYTGDKTHPELRLIHIKHSAQIKEYLMTASEEARRKRRTLHTMDIDSGELVEEEE